MNTNSSEEYALVTGATSGIGNGYACELARMGRNLILVSIEGDKLPVIAKELEEKYAVRVQWYHTDLARTDAAQDVYDHCKKNQWEVGILINNAGIYFFGEAVEADKEKALSKLLLHVVTLSLLCTLFGKDMKERRRGHILNMSSISAWMPYPGLAYYASSKRYIMNFTRSLRSEMLDHNVNVTCVCPGATATNLFDRSKVDYEKAMRKGVMMTAERVAKIALKAMFRRKAKVIPGFFNQFLVPLVRITPAWLILIVKRNTDLIK